jgi:iron(III) transport system substrate-binding protein
MTLVAGLAATALLGSTAKAESWDEIVAAANKEGKVVWYTNQRADGIEPLLAKFHEAYPDIEPEQVRLASNQLVQRFGTEFDADRNLADVVITFADERVNAGLKKGWAVKWKPPELPNFAPQYNQDDMLFTLSHAREVLLYNKNRVSAADAPKEWADLFDPKWKGKVGINPPWRAVPIQQIVAFWQDKGLGDVAAKLKANDVKFFEGSGGVIQAIIRGDVLVAEATDSTLNALLEDGAPVGFVYPQSGTTLSGSVTFVSSKAPHPNAAKVFLNWLMTAEGQEAMQEYLALGATRTGIGPLKHVPATSQLANVVEGITILTPERSKKIVEHWRETFGIR